MSNSPDPFIFFQVSSIESKSAFAFHSSIASSDEHIWPRTEQQIEKFCEDGELFGVRKASSGEYVALCYAHLEEDAGEWELGGLTVIESVRFLGIGSILTNFALAHTIANQRPWSNGQTIIAHVHEANSKPRKVLGRIGFTHVGTVTLPGDIAPKSMKRDAQGNVVGDKFCFEKNKVVQLSNWFDEFDRMLGDGATPTVFDIRPGGLDSLKEALREAANEFAI
jgi:hypothetical protein